MTLTLGEIAPEFSLFSSEHKKVNLTDYRGQNVVILFFPLAFTRVCTAELCTIRDEKSEYDTLNAQVLGISVNEEKDLERFKSEQNYNFTLLSDIKKEVCAEYGAYFFDHGVSKRATFIVDENGILRHAEILENSRDLPDFITLKKILTDLTN